jgi:hypothetical protein
MFSDNLGVLWHAFLNRFRYLYKVFSLINLMPKETKGPTKNDRSKYETTQQTETYRQ